MPFRIIQDPRFKRHRAAIAHPESPDRLIAIENILNRGEFSNIKITPCNRLIHNDELLLAHDDQLVESVAQTENFPFSQLDPDTYACSESNDTSRLAAGALLESVDMALHEDENRIFALVRPPGHHAEKDRAMGFCLFNNAALAAGYAIAKHGLKRIAIYDFDVHHGNGTQKIFYHRPDVLYLSHHQYPFFPGTGNWDETGLGDGSGMTVNLPFPAGSGDPEMLFSWDTILEPIINEYHPELLILSAGYDSHFLDPLAQLNVSDQGFEKLAQRIERFANSTNIPLIFALEGGYNEHALQKGVTSHIIANENPAEKIQTQKPTNLALEILDKAKNTFNQFWKF